MPRSDQEALLGRSVAASATTLIRAAGGTGSPVTGAIRSTRQGPSLPAMKLNRRGTEEAALLMASERAALQVQARGFLLVGLLDAHGVLLEGGLARIGVEQAERQAVDAVVEVEGDE